MQRWMVQRIGLTGLAVISTLILNACSKQLTPEQQQAKAEWQAWVAQQDNITRDGQRSFLNIVDAKYMRPGDSVKLDSRLGANEIRWYSGDDSAVIPAQQQLTVLFDGHNTLLTENGNLHPLTAEDKYLLPNDQLFITVGGLYDNGLRAFIRDPHHPQVVNFKGHHFYDYNPDARLQARFVAAEQPKQVTFQTVQGLTNTLTRVGHLEFNWHGKPVSLSAYHGSSDAPNDYLLLLFKDQTNGDTTYGGGRELVVELPENFVGNEPLIVDFNRTENLNCALSTFWNCPIIWDPALQVAIDAGEQRPYDHGH